MTRIYCMILFACSLTGNCSALSVVDATGQTITLSKPAQRIITLAPSLTEMVFNVGAGDNLIATVKSSNYPAAANKLPRIGDYERINLESLLSFKPDLVLAWNSGNNQQQIANIKKFGISVYQTEPRELTDIAKTLRDIGILSGHRQQADEAANRFLQQLNTLIQANKSKTRLQSFYQIWHEPIYTVNGEHMISRVMTLCGLENVFHTAPVLAPKVSQEAVIEKRPQIIIASGMATGLEDKPVAWLDIWKRWPRIPAVAQDNLYFIHPDLINRQSSRILEGASLMCDYADRARLKLKKGPDTLMERTGGGNNQ